MSEILAILSPAPRRGLAEGRLAWREAAGGPPWAYWREAAASPHLGRFAPDLGFSPSPALAAALAPLEGALFAVLRLRPGESPEAAALRALSLPRAALWPAVLSLETAYPPPRAY